jgi:hypothetical protein
VSNKIVLEKKLEKIQHGFADTVHGLPVKDLEANLLMYAKHREEVKNAMDESKEIKDAKEVVAELTGPYRDTLNAINIKSAYVALLIKEKNGELESGESESSNEEE